jgi:hypothetical protein
MKKPAALLVALVLGATVAACDRSITASEGGHTAGSGNMRADAVVDTTTRSGHTVGSGN